MVFTALNTGENYFVLEYELGDEDALAAVSPTIVEITATPTKPMPQQKSSLEDAGATGAGFVVGCAEAAFAKSDATIIEIIVNFFMRNSLSMVWN